MCNKTYQEGRHKATSPIKGFEVGYRESTHTFKQSFFASQER